MNNDLKIRTLRNAIPRHWINLQIRIKKLQIRFLLDRRSARAVSRSHAATAEQKSRARVAVDISPYPLLGHQVSSWIAGYMWSRELGVAYRGGVVPADRRGLFDFSEDEDHTRMKDERHVRALPVHDERDGKGVPVLSDQLARILGRTSRGVVLRLRRDPQWWDQIPAAPAIRRALLAGYMGESLREFEAGEPYIALHVRRGGDIDKTTTGGADDNQSVHRWVEEDYYLSLVSQIRDTPQLASLPIFVVSVDDLGDFSELASIDNLEFRVDGDRDSDLVFLAGAAVLATSPSSFSFTAALASRGVVIARYPWWHNVPEEGRWVRADEAGTLSPDRLSSALAHVGVS
ncbi:hypothetical protein DEU37_1148 [Microbacterium sp. AG790]|nr:hypothetical protein DEU37_1148 [Microbacterium sp. AG790]